MASNWQETYKKLKKRKEAIDKATNDKELNQAKQSYGRTGKSLYTGKAIGALNSNQTPTKTQRRGVKSNKVAYTSKKTTKKKDSVFSAFDDGYDFGDISKTILKGGKKVGNFIGDEVVEPIKDSRKNYQLGKLSEDLGMEAYKKMMGEDNEYDKLKKKYDRFITENPDLINDANYLDQTIQTLPNQLGALKSGIKGGGIGATAGAILGGTIGAVGSALGTSGVGTGAGALAGATTGAKWLGGTGYVTGSADYTYKLEAGLQYQTLLEMGVPEDIAKEESKDTGTINALIEGGESIVDLVTLGGLSKVKGLLTNGLVKKYGEKTVAGWVGENVVKNAISEGIEEGLQETTSIHNEKQAMERAGLERDDSLDKERIKESVIAGGFAGGLIGGATGVVTGTTKAGVDAIKNKKSVQVEDIAPIKQNEIQETEDLESALRQQNYQYIPKDTDSIQRKTISEDASKYANNTKRTQEFIDLAVNISEASGVNFRLANNESELISTEKNKLIEKYAKNNNVSLEEAAKRFEKTTIDAYNNGEVVINIDSPKALNRLVGHEITHSLENTKEYSNLQRIATEYAKTKGEYDSKIADLNALYEGTNANIDNELTSDLIGDYLFTDQEFINRIHTEDRNLFQRIYDEIKHLYKMATAGSKEARQLEQLQHSFEKAMRENKESAISTNSKVETVQNVKLESENIVQKEQVVERTTPSQAELDNLEDIRLNKSGSEYADAFYSLEKKYGKANLYKGLNSYKTTGKALEYSLSENKSDINEALKTNGILDANNTLNNMIVDSYKEKGSVSEEASGLQQRLKEFTGKYNTDSNNTYIVDDNLVKLSTGIENGTLYIDELYVENERRGTGTKVVNALKEYAKQNGYTVDTFKEVSEAKEFWDKTLRDNTQYSLTDNQGRKLSKEQQEFFKDSKIRDEKGNLKTMYHGSPNDFTTFDRSKAKSSGEFGKGFYFTSDENVANSDYNKDGKVYKVYLNATNPLIDGGERTLTKEQIKQLVTEIANNEDYGIENYGYDATVDSVTDMLNEHETDFQILNDLNISTVGNFVELVEYTNDVIGTTYDGIQNYRQTVVFNSNQIKNVDNLNPTSDPDIRYSLSEDNQKRLEELKAIDTSSMGIFQRGAINNEIEALEKGYSSVEEYRKVQEAERQQQLEEHRKEKEQVLQQARDEEEARKQGIQQDYMMSHRPNTIYGDGSNFEENMPDVFEHPEWYFNTKEAYNMESWRALKKVRNNPEGEITIYRATKGDTFNEGDWITPSRKYAEWHNESNLDGKGKVIELKVKAKDIRFAGDDINEFGYFPNGVTDYSISNFNSQDLPSKIAPTSADIYGSEIKLQKQVQEAIAPLQETIQELNNKITTLQENIAPIEGYTDEDISLSNQRNMESLEAQNIAPIEDTSPDIMPTNEVVNDPFENRDIKAVGNRKVNAYMYENPEVKPFFQQAANEMLGDLDNSIKGEKVWIQELNQDTGLYQESMITGTKRLTTDDIAELLDVYHYSYDQIRNGLNAIIEDNGKENNAVSKRIEFMLNDRLMNGYKSVDGFPIPPSNEYRALIQDKNIQEYTEQAFAEWNKNINQDELAPADIEYVSNSIPKAESVPIENDIAPTDINIPEIQNEPRIENIMFVDPTESLKRQAGRQVAEEMRYTNKSSKVAKTNKQLFGDAYGKLREQFFNSFHYVDKFARDTGNKQIKYNTDMYNNVAAEIDGELTIAQTDNYGNPIGEALLQPFEEAKTNGEYEQLNDYLMHYSNIDRHHVGKGSVVPLEYSKKMITEYDKSNPNLKEYARRVWRGYKNDLANMQSNGLISGQFNMTLQKMYPHYNPFMFEQEFKPSMEEDGVVRPKKVIKRAEGGAFEILEMEEARVRYTQSVRSAIRKNDVLKEIVHASDKTVNIGEDGRIDPTNINQGMGIDIDGNYYATAYVNGQMQQANISEDIYRELMQEGKQKLRALEEKYALITKPLQGAGSLRRNILTTWSPTFMITNPVKDIQDASFNSKYTKDFAKHYPTALVELGRAKTPEAKQFLTLYGTGNTWGEYDTNTKNQKNSKFVKNVVNAVPNFNNLVELAPRFAEFKASLDNGANLQEAMYNAREVTVNFGRGGYVAKALNRNGFTFLNASLQGFDKLARNFSGENGAKGVVGALTKVAILGVAPSVFNALAFGTGDDEDEDYTALPDYIKDNYYLIKTSDGEFIRIPKGRMLSIFGSAARRTMELTQGEKDAFEGYLTNAYSQVGVQNPLESNIFAPIMQAANNKTWYGTDLVPTRLQDKPTEEQYDESTDEFSKWLGQTAVAKKLGISPYKINYVLDQYSGGIGDLILPTITEEATSDGSFLAPIKDKFTANTTFDNKYVSKFYGTRDKMEVKANGSKATDEDLLKSKYLDSVSWEMSELYKEKREIQSNSDLTKQEKFRRVEEIQKQINSLAEEGLNSYENINKTSTYAMVGGKEFYKDANDEWRNPYDDELEELNSLGMEIDDKSSYFEAKNKIYEINEKYRGTEDTYEDRKKDIIEVVRYSNLSTDYKSYLYGKYYSEDTTNIVNMLGINFDSYLDYETQNFVADKDENGKSISGSKKKKVFNYINSMDIGFEEKVILAKLQYNSYDEFNHEIIEYLNNSDITYDEMVFILKQMGFEVDNEGNIYWD